MDTEVPGFGWHEPLDPSLRFETYVHPEKIADSVAGAQHFAAGKTDYGARLVLVALPGADKKHLLHAVCHAWNQRTATSAVLTTAPAWFRAFVRSMRLGEAPQLAAEALDVGLFVLDGLQLFAGKEITQQALSRLLGERMALGRPVLIAAEAAPAEIRNLSLELLDLLARGATVAVPRQEA